MFRKTCKKVEKVWGHEKILCNSDLYCAKILHIDPNCQCSLHYHPVKHETFYVLKGIVRMEVGSSWCLMEKGESVDIKPGTSHRFGSVVNSEILEISTFHSDDDVVRLEESRIYDRRIHGNV